MAVGQNRFGIPFWFPKRRPEQTPLKSSQSADTQNDGCFGFLSTDLKKDTLKKSLRLAAAFPSQAERPLEQGIQGHVAQEFTGLGSNSAAMARRGLRFVVAEMRRKKAPPVAISEYTL